MSKRLVKVAKELNVGTKTIVEFLNSNGFQMSNKPTAKISAEMYDLLAKNFQKSIAIKERADKITIGTRKKEEKPKDNVKPWERPTLASKEPKSLSLDNNKSVQPEENVEETSSAQHTPKDEVTKPNPPVAKEETKKESPATKQVDSQVKGPKILGKINLDTISGGNRGSKRKQQKEKESPKNKDQKKETVAKKAQEPEKKVVNTAPKEVVSKPEAKEIKVDQQNKNASQDVKKEIKSIPKQEQKKENPVADNKGNVEKKEAEVPNQKKEVKNPDKGKQTPPIKAKDKPTKSDEPKPESKDENIKTPPQDKDASAEGKEEGVDIKVKAPQLKGLKILGKINVDRGSRKKRRRSSNNTNRQNQQSSDSKSQNRDRNAGAGGEQGNRGGGNRRERGDRGNNQQRNRNQGQNRDRRGGNNDNKQNANSSNNRDRVGSNNNRNSGNRGNYSDSSRNRDNNRNQNTQGSNSGGGNGGDNKRPRKKITRGNNDQGRENSGPPKTDNNDNNKSGGRGGRGRDKNRRGKDNSRDRDKKKRKEPSQKDVNEKLKQTMARLQGGKSKRSRKHGTRRERDEKKERQREQNLPEETKPLQVTEFISVSELAGLMDISPTEIIMLCMKEKIYVSINQRLDADVIELIGVEFGHEIEFISAEDQIAATEEEEEEVNEEALEDRAPIVTVMGHVDHGKTSLLDRIRKTNVADGEAGGITQHIGAYEVRVADPEGGSDLKSITFLDTPGHEAFTAMRARGAKVTDVAVIIIAADDNVMPQTKEAISHAQAAGVPIVFAINKIDKDGASPDRIKEELSRMNLLVEDWGGSFQSQEISAKKGLNIEDLLEKILLEAEMLELKADPTRKATGTVLEASMEKGRGFVTKILVQSGTLKIGDTLVAGHHYGKIRAMFNERGQRIKKAGPSTPVLILGMQGAPQAGEKFKVMSSEKEAKSLANKRAQIVRQQQIRATRRITLKDITDRLKVGNFQELKLIVKGDMDGSVEALADSLLKLKTDQIQTTVVHKAVGQITESDVNLAAASDAIIIGFQVRPNPMARKLAEQEGIEIKTYSVIYDAIEEIKSALEGMLEPKQVEEQVALIDILQVFKISKVGAVAGCMVREGKVTRNDFVRVIRDGIVMYPKKEGVHGKLGSLKRFKDNVSEVKFGTECGITIDGYDHMREGDVLEIYNLKEVKQKLNLNKGESDV
ncbi:MAG: translation initiation factor IF-2 [Saprospiraceae bacterium]|nr:translation initiation factor IF-2 [Saprospiraceae bacterium]